MASVASQLIEEVTAHVQRDSLKGGREIRTDGTYFPNNLRNKCTRYQFCIEQVPVPVKCFYFCIWEKFSKRYFRE